MDAEIFQQAARKYKDSIFRIALNYCKNPADADDITQNVLIRFYKSKKDFDSEEHLRNWLIRVAVNESKRWLSSPYHAFTARTVDIYEADIAQEFDLEPEESMLYKALMSLPAKYRVVLYMHYYEDYPVSEIAELLNSRTSTVTTRLARGRERLKQALERCYQDERTETLSQDLRQAPRLPQRGKGDLEHEKI